MPSTVYRALEIRPLEPGDRSGLAAAFDRLSADSRHQRFLGPKPRLTEAELDALTLLDHINRDAVVAVERATGRLVAVARYAVHADDPDAADVAVTVADDWRRLGLGFALSRAVVRRAAASGIARLTGSAFHDNAASRGLMRKLGFRLCGRAGSVIDFALDL
jgi:RimJ/RimL family protein N-acetyltransferase